MSKTNQKNLKVYVGEEIEWIHPGTGLACFATVTSIEVSNDGTPITVNVKGENFTDGCSYERLSATGNLH